MLPVLLCCAISHLSAFSQYKLELPNEQQHKEMSISIFIIYVKKGIHLPVVGDP